MPSVAPKYERPTSMRVALSLLKQGFVPIAGATDYYPGKVGRPLVENLLDLGALEDMQFSLGAENGAVLFSALTTWRQCQSGFGSGALPIWCAALAISAKEVGGWQVQNRGTLGGNLCNASPAADGVVALLALGAAVVLVSEDQAEAGMALKSRSLELENFVLGNRLTAKIDNELLTQIVLPKHSTRARSTFLKLGHRKYLVISIVMVAVLLDFDDADCVITCRIAIGSCSKAALRITALENRLLGCHREQVLEVTGKHIEDAFIVIQPIDDVRGTAVYRKYAARQLTMRAITEVLQ